ncbi:hypothetical protein PMIN06_002166 [Paraphaeosphaeria minitans]
MTHLGHPDCARQASPTLPQRRMHSPPANAKARGPQQARHHAGVLPVLLVASRNHGLAEHRIRTKGGAARGGLLVALHLVAAGKRCSGGAVSPNVSVGLRIGARQQRVT